MVKKDHKAIDLEILTSVSELNDYIKEVDGKINDLMMHVNSAKSDDKVKSSKVRIGALKKTQEDVKQRFNDFIMMKNCQHGNQGNQGNLEMNKSFEDLKAGIEEFKKEEDNVNELMMIQFDKSDDLGKDTGVWIVIKGEEQYVCDAASGEEKCSDFLSAKINKFEIQEDYMDKMMKMKQDIPALKSEELGIQGIKTQEDYFNNEEAPAFDRSDHSSVVDFEKITGSASSDDLEVGPTAENEVLEQKMRELVLERKELLNIDEDDLKKSLMECVKELSDTTKI